MSIRTQATKYALVGVARAAEVAVRYGFVALLALSAGAVAAGLLFLALAIVAVLGQLARFGLDAAATREIAVAWGRGDRGRARGVLVSACKLAGGAGALLGVALFLCAPALSDTLFRDPALAPVLRALSLAVPAAALMACAAAALNAIGRPTAGQLLVGVVWPGVGCVALGSGYSVPAVAAWISAAFAVGSAAGLGFLLWLTRDSSVVRVPAGPLVRLSLPLGGVEAVQLLQFHLPTILLGIFASSEQVGLFGIAYRVSALLIVVYTAQTLVVSPPLATAFAAGDWRGFQRAARASSLLVTPVALCGALVLSIGAEPIMGLFGTEFRDGAPLLVLLAIGLGATAPFTVFQPALSMAGHERAALRNALIAAVPLVAVGVALIPPLGATGAALAMLSSTWTLVLANAFTARVRLGLPLGLLRG